MNTRASLIAAMAAIALVLVALHPAAAQVRQRAPAPETTTSYGPDRLQAYDAYLPETQASALAPAIVFVHGGGWSAGDKGGASHASKARWFPQQGYAFFSVNYRLVPDAKVEQQAADVAAALAEIRSRAGEYGIDPDRIVLAGHSAGAHLAALVATDESYLAAHGLSPRDLAGVLLLDGAGYDVPAQMKDTRGRAASTYEAAFGNDPKRQRALSPLTHVGGADAPAFLILHVERPESRRQGEALGASLKASGISVQVTQVEGRGMRGHARINRALGSPEEPATPIVADWLARLFGY